ncbi:MAG: 4'-phosphopantetheinyl transferase superfamily protein [Candidatus Aureabacteria bacterium]|nr:4'-phosphopantetheinyl transferase superfamily protein [Candidatus Auribacterota bacterium]
MSRTCSSELVAIGIDVVEISKVRTLLSYGPLRLNRVFGPPELARAGNARSAAPLNASRCLIRRMACAFAVKEAVFKSLGRGWGQGMRWSEVCATRGENGRWSVTLRGQALQRLRTLGGSRVEACVSTAGNHTIAQAFIWGNSK